MRTDTGIDWVKVAARIIERREQVYGPRSGPTFARKIGVSKQTLSRWEQGATIRKPDLETLRRELGMAPPWPLDEGEETEQPILQADRDWLNTWYKVPKQHRIHLEALARALLPVELIAEPTQCELAQTDIERAKERRKKKAPEPPLVGRVAAREESARVDFAAWEESSSELARVIVDGNSMESIYPDGTELLVKRANLNYKVGDIVIAETGAHGLVCKRYKRQRHGVVTLESCTERKIEPITGPRTENGEEGIDGISVRAVVVGVYESER